MGKRAVQTQEAKGCAWSAPPGIKGSGHCESAQKPVGLCLLRTALPQTLRMRLVILSLLTCTVLGKCRRGEGPLHSGPRHTTPWAPCCGWKHRSLSSALSLPPHFCTCFGTAWGQLCASAQLLALACASVTFSCFS